MSDSPSPPAGSSQRLAARIPDRAFTPRFWIYAYVAWFALLFILSSTSGSGGPDFPTHTDKVAHFLYFAAGGAALGAVGLLRNPPLGRPALVVGTLAAGALVGLFDEWHQTFTPNRTGLDSGDWIADFLGTSAGLAFAVVAFRCLRANGLSLPPSDSP